MRTFYLKPEQWRHPFVISGQEARHMTKALRLKSGETVRLLDGCGKSGEFAIDSISDGNVTLTPLNIEEIPAPNGRCYLAAAYTKAARRSFMLEKAVELEAGGVWFWQADYSQGKVPPDAKSAWREQLMAGAKQSANPWLPDLKTLPGGAAQVCSEAAPFTGRFLLWEDAASSDMLQFEDVSGAENILFVMGPEGGLSRNEVKIFTQQGFKPVSLGRRILRWETAAVFCLGVAWWAREVRLAKI